jgi:integrase
MVGRITRPEAVDTDPLFPSRKTGRPITVSTLNNLVKGWCRAVGLRGNYGSHTLRKTFGYVHRTVFKTDIATLMLMYNHSTQRQTLAYLGIQPDEVQEAYLREI